MARQLSNVRLFHDVATDGASSMAKRSRGLHACCCVLVTCATYAQAADTGSAKPVDTISTTSRNVVLDVIVTGSAGTPIHGLTARDFTILENGKPQPLKGSEEHRSGEQSSKAPVSVQLPSDTYTNYVTSTRPGAINIILFDSLNTDRTSLTSARQQLLSYLAKLPDDAHVALFTLDGRLHLVHGFTDDNRALVEAAQRLSSSPNPLMRGAREVTDELVDAMMVGLQASPGLFGSVVRSVWGEYDSRAESRTAITMEALNELARSVAIFPGRKNLIWISGGIPFDPVDTTPQMQRTAALLAVTQMAVYPIDVHGIAYLGADGTSPSPEVFGPGGEEFSSQSGQADELLAVRETMFGIAQLTGGRAYLNHNDISGQIQDIIDSGSNYYTLAYRPENQDWNGKFRKVSVKTSQPNVKVRTRPGYYAVKDPFGSADVDRTFSLAMQPSVPPSTALVMQARVLPPAAPENETQIDFLVDVRDLQFLISADQRRQPNLMFVTAAWDERGNAQGSVSGTYQQILQPADVQVLLRTGLRLQQQLSLKPGHYQLRLGLVDRMSGKIGTIDVPLTVKPS
jgi:VWFA-related protein